MNIDVNDRKEIKDRKDKKDKKEETRTEIEMETMDEASNSVCSVKNPISLSEQEQMISVSQPSLNELKENSEKEKKGEKREEERKNKKEKEKERKRRAEMDSDMRAQSSCCGGCTIL